MLVCCVAVCVAEALQALPTSGCTFGSNKEFEDVLWKEQGDLYCGTPLFHHENTHPNCWGFQLTVELSSVCDIEQKSPKQADTLV